MPRWKKKKQLNNGWTAKRVVRLRKKLKMSRKEMATELGVHWQTLARWEQGYFEPSVMASNALDLLEMQSRTNTYAGSP